MDMMERGQILHEGLWILSLECSNIDQEMLKGLDHASGHI